MTDIKRWGRRILVSLLLGCCLLLSAAAACAETESRNPLLNPQPVQYVETEHRFFNVLFAGIDFGPKGYRGSFGKKELEECHADAMLVISLDMDDNTVDLVSLPRDSVTYVPGVHGIYKLNGAVNCAETVEEGLQRACDAASWLLGGVEVSHYCAVDMKTMIALGDLVGGVDFDMDMAYTGHSGRKYVTGMQHLDGQGIMDYLRARTNATHNSNDIGRTGRHRELMMAIFQKIKDNPLLIPEIISVIQDPEQTLLTNISLAQMLELLPYAASIDTDSLGSHVVTGVYRTALDGWNFTFTDQEKRQAVIREVYGFEPPEIPYVSQEYCAWLMDTGFRTVRYVGTARKLLEYADTLELTQEQEKQIGDFEALLDQTIAAFDDAADSLSAADRKTMEKTRKKLRDAGEALIDALKYPERVNWSAGATWYNDPRINEYQYKWQ